MTSGRLRGVGQANTSIYTRVPPGQARDVEEYVFFNPSPRIRGRMEWSYAIGEIAGDD